MVDISETATFDLEHVDELEESTQTSETTTIEELIMNYSFLTCKNTMEIQIWILEKYIIFKSKETNRIHLFYM